MSEDLLEGRVESLEYAVRELNQRVTRQAKLIHRLRNPQKEKPVKKNALRLVLETMRNRKLSMTRTSLAYLIMRPGISRVDARRAIEFAIQREFLSVSKGSRGNEICQMDLGVLQKDIDAVCSE